METALHVDGVGTKAILALELVRLETAGRDCVTVNVNDVVCDGLGPSPWWTTSPWSRRI